MGDDVPRTQLIAGVDVPRTQLLVRTAYRGGRLVGTLGGLSDTSHVHSSACRLHLVNDVLWISSPFLWDHACIEADLAFE